MTYKTEGMLAIVAALIVLFSSLWDPRVSVVMIRTSLNKNRCITMFPQLGLL